ncbi:NADP-dependent oxidoreductase [Kineosporia succinea]|uniref:NADPH:quinone reductase-like Zn-dependent oxidoreductase n=1 Tax=Kineosporia succinea TaxID=84632 RepID=A0ABT9P945_9ACTN|nr:NADP-dependent oxidoreductase [Kineosporia succinea]MDP9829203.1 NADPH:quinone reductase-like Zn-dependent oxidoreductase [Kineosporia succinea]
MDRRWVATGFGGPEVLELVEYAAADPGVGEVRIAVRAAGMNPADFKGFAAGPGKDPAVLPKVVGFEVAGVVDAAGDDSGFGVGDEVLAFRVSGGYASRITVPARDVLRKPAGVGFAEAANLLLAGATAADMLHVTAVTSGDTIVVHGASGAVGVSVLQQARAIGARVIGTASERNFDVVRGFGGVPVAYGDGLLERLRELAPEGYVAALDTVGTDEAADTSLALVQDRRRIVTIAAWARAERDGFLAVGGNTPESKDFRDRVRQSLVDLAGAGRLEVPIARTFPLHEAPAALEVLMSGHPGGKLALLP